ncbi:MAG: T9SS type A sorting domain-containing protein [Flavobacteriales bacterium]|nr:T9SS type A sorting domain-containing protein [Flavobacteriales bacterium]
MSVQENDRISSLSLSPNPAQNELRVELGRLGRGIPATLRIFDATGRQVHQEAMSNPVTRVDVSTLKGLLLVMVEQGGTRWMGKVVVQ